VRGPTCAALLADRAAAAAREGSETAAAQQSLTFSVLQGGFDAWHEAVGPGDQFTEETKWGRERERERAPQSSQTPAPRLRGTTPERETEREKARERK
jgi:hypothetical protein